MTENPEISKIHVDARNLRGIAHPVRVRILGLLRADGPDTATGLARQLGLNTGATSYHLRQLSESGFIVEDAERGTGRERWWKAAHWSTTFDSDELAGDGVGEVYLRSVAQIYADRMLRAVDDMSTLPQQWRSAGTFSDVLLKLTPEELERLNDEIFETVKRYRSAVPGGEEAPEGSARVTFQFQSFPYAPDMGPAEDEQ